MSPEYRPPDPYAPPQGFPSEGYPPPTSQGATQEERSNAMLAHVLSIFAGFLGPLIIYLAKRKESRFVGFHALQALLWHTVLMVMMFGGMIVFLATMGGLGFFAARHSEAKEPPAAFFLAFFGMWGVMMLSWFVNIGFCIYMATQASSGKWNRYPVVGALARRWSGLGPES